VPLGRRDGKDLGCAKGSGNAPVGTVIRVRRDALHGLPGRGCLLIAAVLIAVVGAGCSTSPDATTSAPGGEGGTALSASPAPPVHSEPGGDGSEPVVRTEGRFEPIGYDGTGTAQVVVLTDGRLQVRLTGFEVEQGPALHVYLSAAKAGSPERTYDDDFIDLGELRGFEGDQTFAIPDGTDMSLYRSVVIWCAEFSVGFVVAPLDAR